MLTQIKALSFVYFPQNYYKGIKSNIAAIREGERRGSEDDDEGDDRDGNERDEKKQLESLWKTYFRVFVKVTRLLGFIVLILLFLFIVVKMVKTHFFFLYVNFIFCILLFLFS